MDVNGQLHHFMTHYSEKYLHGQQNVTETLRITCSSSKDEDTPVTKDHAMKDQHIINCVSGCRRVVSSSGCFTLNERAFDKH